MQDFTAELARKALVFQTMNLEDVLDAVGIVTVYGCTSVSFKPSDESVKEGLRDLGYEVAPCFTYHQDGYKVKW